MTVQPDHMPRPDLTMPPEEASALRLAYGEAGVILEYGVGSSTKLAASLPGKHVTTVESDRSWVARMEEWLEANPPADGTTVDLVWSDIGPTREWGHPQSDAEWRKFPSYPLAVWSRDGFRHPDVVFVDGRFRIGCALATAFCIKRPVTVLIDDYAPRKWLHQVEDFIGEPEIIGRLGVFEVNPTQIPANRLLQIFRFMTAP